MPVEIVDPGLPAPMNRESLVPLVSTLQRYDSGNEQRLYRTLLLGAPRMPIALGYNFPIPWFSLSEFYSC